MAKRFNYDHVTKVATTDEGMTISDAVYFHAFNPRGVVAAQRRTDELIRKAVDEGKAKSGAVIAYGSRDSFCYDMIVLRYTQAQPSRRQLNVVLDMYRERNARAEAFLKTIG